ncbi:MAG TPA: PilZ domain-containing protein [Vicinamibacterales bacterium]|nr:PilZ domain-containing protein [Vicinamibacterales bacterium]
MGPSAFSRRRDMRLGAPRNLRVTIGAEKAKAVPHDISMGGLSILATAPIALRTVHTVHLKFGSIEVVHKVRVQHCRRAQRGWFVGMAFVDKPLEASATITRLFSAILESAITFS